MNTLTRYEMTRIVGLRALQIEKGASPFVDVSSNEDPVGIASRELEAGLIDCFVVRGDKEISIRDLILPNELFALLDTKYPERQKKNKYR